jgi:hypothetical protein
MLRPYYLGVMSVGPQSDAEFSIAFEDSVLSRKDGIRNDGNRLDDLLHSRLV